MPTIYRTITDREAIIWAKLMAQQADEDAQIELAESIELIDQALTLQQNKALLTKKRGLKKDLNLLLSRHCGEEALDLR